MISRRHLLTSAALAALAITATPVEAIPWTTPTPTRKRRPRPILLRGGRFRVRLRDDSLLPTFAKGTIVECENCHPTDVADGEFVLVRFGDVTTLRQARRPTADGVLLRGTNPGGRNVRRRVAWADVDRLAVVVGTFAPLAAEAA
jgi:hypothetical protein